MQTKHEVGDAAAEVDEQMRGTLDDIALLVKVAERGFSDDDAEMEKEAETAEKLGLVLDEGNPEEAADERIFEWPLCVERTLQFEIVLGTGGPDTRLIVECSLSTESTMVGETYTPEGSLEIDRILYRYSWTGSAERVLYGDDLVAAEAFARRLLPELS